MNISIRRSIGLLRISLGALFFYAGISKIMDPAWPAAGYLSSAKTFPSLYSWFASPENIGWINFTNEWGLTLIGLALILGIAVRPAAFGGMLLVLLYYFPVLDFPYAGEHFYIVDDHIIYLLALLVVYTSKAGSWWSVNKYLGISL